MDTQRLKVKSLLNKMRISKILKNVMQEKNIVDWWKISTAFLPNVCVGRTGGREKIISNCRLSPSILPIRFPTELTSNCDNVNAKYGTRFFILHFLSISWTLFCVLLLLVWWHNAYALTNNAMGRRRPKIRKQTYLAVSWVGCWLVGWLV